MAKTYGMHFIDYFPHREKGIIYYNLGEYNIAGKELKLSLSYEKTAKALLFLDRVRKKIFENKGQTISIPEIFVNGIDKNKILYTNSDSFVFSGYASDPQYIKEMYLNEMPVYIESSSQKLKFEQRVMLPKIGEYKFIIKANNLRNGENSKTVLIVVDRSGPVLMIEKLVLKSKLIIHGNDDSGKISLYINDRHVQTIEDKKALFEVDISSINSPILLCAIDRAGNKTLMHINNKYSLKNNRVLIAENSLYSDFISDAFPTTMESYLLSKNLKMIDSVNFQAQNTEKSDISIKSSKQSNIQIKINSINNLESIKYNKNFTKINNLNNILRTYFKKIELQVQLISKDRIKKITINNIPVEHNNQKNFYFSHTSYLDSGINTIDIIVEDYNGIKKTKKIVLNKLTREIDKPVYRYNLALHSFKYFGSFIEDQSFKLYFYNSLNDLKRFNLLPRDAYITNLSALDRELLLNSNNDLSIASNTNLFGYVLATKKGIEIVCRMVDQTSEIENFIDIYDDTQKRFDLKYLTQKIAEKIHRKYPQVYGYIGNAHNDALEIIPEIWKPARNELKLRRPAIIYKEVEDIHVLGSNSQIIGYSTIKRIMEENFQIKLFEKMEFKDKSKSDALGNFTNIEFTIKDILKLTKMKRKKFLNEYKVFVN